MVVVRDSRPSRLSQGVGPAASVRPAAAPAGTHSLVLERGRRTHRLLPSPGAPAAVALRRSGSGRTARKEARYLRAKRLLDVVVAGGALFVLAPVFALVALAIVVEGRGRGPILFCQTRVGRNGHPFAFYKFRSMVTNAEALKEQLAAQNEAKGAHFKMRRDPRVTRVGRVLRKYSLDELPQLWSVLKGDMTLVGPRPHLPCEVASYSARQRKRLCVRPGLLCLREVGGRSHLTWDEWLESDLQYLEHRSLRTDLSILLRTVPAVLKGDGAF